MQQHWKVGDLAKLTGLTVRTLRFYDQIGLFTPSGYSDTGHRLYSEADIKRLHQILSLKDLGLSLEEIQSLLKGHTYSPSELVAIQAERVRKNIENQRKLLAELERLKERMDDKESPSIDAFIPLLETMRLSHEKYMIERRLNWERRLDLLGDVLSDN
ncbi:MerR family transcriptional regulator [Paenibacillus sp. N1-5-1-14]|uniref:MerR family transcriptional regulator n=1 Tax=Paenibacillus radicibacter TaxID=2972488 RepID=UPI002158FD1E|nr:MerR family transcriptional regulator [Paenibacillus radicibacter]MCR8643305.1 MerR family transcriptional regulator [Paenibacillus radicibacter]